MSDSTATHDAVPAGAIAPPRPGTVAPAGRTPAGAAPPTGVGPAARAAAVGSTAPAAAVGPAARAAAVGRRLATLVVAVGAFVTALGLMKAGASALIPTLQGSVFTDGAWSTLGLGWLGAGLVLSGSPVAASALTLLDGGAIDRTQAFTMLTGSRLGASFVVLVVGFLYATRRRGRAGRRAPLSIGVLSLFMTVVAYLPGAALGWLLLEGGGLDGVHLAATPSMVSVTDRLFGWAVDGADAVLPGWALFPVGLAVLLGAFKLLDGVLPHVDSERLEDRPPAWYRSTWGMFAMGCVVALLTLSVSVALTVLVPLVAAGKLRRDEALPYIAGANVTTLADTLVAAVVLGNQDAVRVVLAEGIGVGAWTLLLVGVLFPLVRRGALGFSARVLADRRRLVGFVGVLFVLPVVLVALP